MRVIIAGTREATKAETRAGIDAAVSAGTVITSVVSGGARGADLHGEAWGKENKIPVFRYPAQWGLHGKSAGPKRNALMAQNADALIAIWDGASKGTADMISQAQAAGLRVYIHLYPLRRAK